MAPPVEPRGLPIDGGLGTLRPADDPRLGPVEILALMPQLSTATAEHSIRAAVKDHQRAGLTGPAGPLGAVHKVSRVSDGLFVVSPVVDGVKLLDLLDALDARTFTLPDDAILDLAASIARTVAFIHERPAAVVHGAVSPAHIVVNPEGGIVLTNAVFAQALQSLNWSRHQWWWQCGLALPPSASLPRFDQRADVVQLGGVVLALLLRRRLTADDYASIGDLVKQASAAYKRLDSGLRGWLQQTLHLHPRATFSSGVDASAQLALVLSDGGGARPSLRSRTVLKNLAGGMGRVKSPARR